MLWEELLVLSRFHHNSCGRVEFWFPAHYLVMFLVAFDLHKLNRGGAKEETSKPNVF